MINFKIIPGIITYSQGMAIMDDEVNNLIDNKTTESVLLLEHHDVYTAGSSFKAEELKNPGNIEVIYTGRGGKFTYHGPGQRIIYPILNLGSSNRKKDLKLYIQNLERLIIDTLAKFGIKAFTKDRMIGIWVKHNNLDKKIAAIGVRVKKWVTYHGVAVNINTDLSKFNGITPCGITEYGVTSMQELGINCSFDEFDSALKYNFQKIFGRISS